MERTHELTPKEGMCVVDPYGAVQAIDAILSKTLGASPMDPEARLAEVLSQPPLRDALNLVFAEQPDGSSEASIEVAIGAAASASVHITRLQGPRGLLAVLTFRTVPASDEARADALTGLPDRRAASQRVARWGDASQKPPMYAVLFMDLDDFKRINDQHGHQAGDAVLQALARRWLRCVRDGDLVARYGGDEFVILLRDAKTRREAEPIIQRLQEATAEPVEIGEQPLQVTCTIGVAFSRGGDSPVEEIIAAADRDMYASKPSARPIAPR